MLYGIACSEINSADLEDFRPMKKAYLYIDHEWWFAFRAIILILFHVHILYGADVKGGVKVDHCGGAKGSQ
ncbi:MAG TPA: hypothetical protein VME23_03235 [Terracidiphilus sp.]|nr:hypothetical protein [Terracidiphilus sp.]